MSEDNYRNLLGPHFTFGESLMLAEETSNINVLVHQSMQEISSPFYGRCDYELIRMAHLYRIYKLQSNYMDKRSNVSRQEWIKQLESSSTVYVGNLSFYTTEDQVFQLFKECGDIELIVMGLNRMNRAPCGFCFVQYKNHGSAFKAVEILNGSSLDQRQIRVDWDSGKDILNDNRKFGRGVSGGQWRDEFRTSFDPGRGGEGGGMEYIQRKRYKRSRYNDINYWSKYFENPEPAKRIRVAPHIKTDVAAEQ